MTKKLKVCKNGHEFYKSSDCPTCPKCEELKKPKEGFLLLLGSPARQALEVEGIISLEKLAKFSEKEILALHGMGKATIPILKEVLRKQGLEFKSPTTISKKTKMKIKK